MSGQRTRPLVNCAKCNHDGPHYGRLLCMNCYRSERRAGMLDRWPRVPQTGLPALNRRREYAELRSWGLTMNQAAERMGVCRRSADRFEAWMRQQAWTP